MKSTKGENKQRKMPAKNLQHSPIHYKPTNQKRVIGQKDTRPMWTFGLVVQAFAKSMNGNYFREDWNFKKKKRRVIILNIYNRKWQFSYKQLIHNLDHVVPLWKSSLTSLHDLL